MDASLNQPYKLQIMAYLFLKKHTVIMILNKQSCIVSKIYRSNVHLLGSVSSIIVDIFLSLYEFYLNVVLQNIMQQNSYALNEAKGISISNDPVCSTWRYLKQQVNGVTTQNAIPLYEIKDHPLATARIIPRRLADVLKTQPENEKQVRE